MKTIEQKSGSDPVHPSRNRTLIEGYERGGEMKPETGSVYRETESEEADEKRVKRNKKGEQS